MINGVSNMNRKSQQSPGGTGGHHHLIGSPPPPPPSSGDHHAHKTPLSVNVDGGGGRPNGLNSSGGELDSPAEGLPPRNIILPPLDKPRGN